MDSPIKILHLEDVRSDAELVERELKRGELKYEIRWVSNRRDFENTIGIFNPDIVLSDHSLPTLTSQDAFQIVKDVGKNVPVILVTATVSEEFAVDMMRQGVADYILKDRMQRLPVAVYNAVAKWRLEKQKQRYIDKLIQSEVRFRMLIENSEEMITLINADGSIEYMSPAVERVFGGISSGNKKQALDIVHPEDRETASQQLNEVSKYPGVAIPFILRNQRKDKTTVWVEGKLTNLLQVDGVNAIVANFRDITTLKEGTPGGYMSEKNI